MIYYFLFCILTQTFAFYLQASESAVVIKETPLKEKHDRWIKNLDEAQILEKPKQAAAFDKLNAGQKPWPEAFQVYLESSKGHHIALVQDAELGPLKIVRIYENTKGLPHYTTIGSLDPKETFIAPGKKNSCAHSKRQDAKGTSGTYPLGCKAYTYNAPEGFILIFQRGHGIPHKDTHKGASLNSDTDPENFAPQNEKYNSPIRRDLEEKYRKENITYKEISVYYKDAVYEVTAEKEKLSVPIPEGFLVFAYATNGEIKDVYYFPNFIDYKALKRKQKKEYKEFPEFYKIERLKKFIYIPIVNKRKIESHLKKISALEKLKKRLLKNSKAYFKRFTQKEMPQKARVALLAMLLEKHMQAIASLEFETFDHQLALIRFYVVPTQILKFDCRTNKQQKEMIDQFLESSNNSKTAKQIVRFLKEQEVSFFKMQKCLHALVKEFQCQYEAFGVFWDLKVIKPEDTRYVIEVVEGSAHLKKYTAQINSDNLSFDLTAINPQDDVSALKELAGGYNPCNVDYALKLIEIVDRRLQERKSVTKQVEKEKYDLLWLYKNYPALDYDKRESFWRRKLIEEHGENESFIFLRLSALTDENLRLQSFS